MKPTGRIALKNEWRTDKMAEVFTSKQKFGFGLMRLPLTNPDDGGSIDLEETKKMVDTFLEKGFTYFDTAWMYCNFKSENAAKDALVDRHPRDSFSSPGANVILKGESPKCAC